MYACVHVPSPNADGLADQTTMDALRRCADAFAPQHELVSACTIVFPVDGLGQLHPSLSRLVAALKAKADELGLAAQIGLAPTPLAAVQAALAYPGPTVVHRGEEAQALAPVPVSALGPPQSVAAILAQWGVRTLGELAALPEDGLAARLGDEGRQLRRLALGLSPRPLVPEAPVLVFTDTQELEEPLAVLEPLLFLLARSLDVVCQALARQGYATDELRLNLRLESRDEHIRQVRLPVPTRDQKVLLKLVQLDLAAHPPPSAVTAYTLLAQPAAPRAWQHGLFAPPTPEPGKREILLARLTALLGPDQVGSPVIEDTHRPDAWHLARFAPPRKAHPPVERRAVLAVRYYRPPRPARVWLAEERPVRLEAVGASGAITQAAGPWPSAGAWWTPTPWSREDWDVELATGTLYRLFHDVDFEAWFVEGHYD